MDIKKNTGLPLYVCVWVEWARKLMDNHGASGMGSCWVKVGFRLRSKRNGPKIMFTKRN